MVSFFYGHNIFVSNIVLAVICNITYVEKLKPEGKHYAHNHSSHL